MSLAKEAADKVDADTVAARLRNVAGKSKNPVTSALARIRAQQHQVLADIGKGRLKSQSGKEHPIETAFGKMVEHAEKGESLASAARQARSDNPLSKVVGKLRLKSHGVSL